MDWLSPTSPRLHHRTKDSTILRFPCTSTVWIFGIRANQTRWWLGFFRGEWFWFAISMVNVGCVDPSNVNAHEWDKDFSRPNCNRKKRKGKNTHLDVNFRSFWIIRWGHGAEQLSEAARLDREAISGEVNVISSTCRNWNSKSYEKGAIRNSCNSRQPSPRFWRKRDNSPPERPPRQWCDVR